MILTSFGLRKSVSVLGFALVIGLFTQISFASTIAGFVYGSQNTALFDVDVELLNENYQLRGRTKTDGAGRYEFSQLPDGTYTVRVMPFRYDYQDQQQKINIETLSVRGAGIGNSYVTMDFYLKPKKGGITEYEVGVIFAQDVPKEARSAYKKADQAFLAKRNQEGVDELFSALKLFPDYYDALYRMGKELFILEKYDASWQYLLKATQVNPKSGVAFYYLGESFHKLGTKLETKDYNKVAMNSLKQAAILIPGFAPVFYTLGKVERSAGKFNEAEQHLLKAKKLAKKTVPEIQKELAQLYADDLKNYGKAADALELYLKASKLSKEEEAEIKEVIANLRKKAAPQT